QELLSELTKVGKSEQYSTPVKCNDTAPASQDKAEGEGAHLENQEDLTSGQQKQLTTTAAPVRLQAETHTAAAKIESKQEDDKRAEADGFCGAEDQPTEKSGSRRPSCSYLFDVRHAKKNHEIQYFHDCDVVSEPNQQLLRLITHALVKPAFFC
ncbi:unnamed protein product, partial [Amoebophrya sp. A120]